MKKDNWFMKQTMRLYISFKVLAGLSLIIASIYLISNLSNDIGISAFNFIIILVFFIGIALVVIEKGFGWIVVGIDELKEYNNSQTMSVGWK